MGEDAPTVAVLTGTIGGQPYALEIAYVVEVVSMVALMPVNALPPEVLGVANRHGSALPILDLRRVLTHQDAPVTAATLFVVVMIEERMAGLVFDEVHQVAFFPADRLSLTASGKFIRGIIGDGDRLIQLIAVQQLFASYLSGVRVDDEIFES